MCQRLHGKGCDCLSSLSKEYEFAMETGCNDIPDTECYIYKVKGIEPLGTLEMKISKRNHSITCQKIMWIGKPFILLGTWKWMAKSPNKQVLLYPWADVHMTALIGCGFEWGWRGRFLSLQHKFSLRTERKGGGFVKLEPHFFSTSVPGTSMLIQLQWFCLCS